MDARIEFKTAELAKSKGFTESVTEYYTLHTTGRLDSDSTLFSPEDEFDCVYYEDFPSSNFNSQDDFPWKFYSAPTQTHLRRWLAETHDIHVCPTRVTCVIDHPSGTESLNFNGTYEECMELGLQYALNLIP